ncbi:MAG TPA: DegT/DnrJ/EryC1/StrS family aminotransferase [Thermoanaerobaculia bacterium]|nr:DegT/DnrJ/EryC1/StrS family aminotransferase [Thermoanaerobaculia bacterium]
MSVGDSVPLLDLTRYDEELKRDIARRVQEVFETGRFVMGPANDAFEKAFAKEVGAAHAVGVSSGTDAVLVSLMALGVGPGDEVVTSPFTFFASAGEVARLNAKPVFVDIEPETLNLDPERLEAAVTGRTKAIQPVHLYGQCADMAPILEIAARRGVPVVEDACQAIGASDHGRPAGAMGTMAAFSFYPTKNLGAAGDAGAVTTDDPELAKALATLRMHGETSRYHHARVGGNFRLDAIQAAVLLAKLPRLKSWNERRRAIAARYGELFSDAARAEAITLPFEAPGKRHVYHQYVVRVQNRDAVRERLSRAGIATAVFYPVPLHMQECFADLGYREGSLPVAEKAAGEVLALPIFAEMRDDEVERVAEAVLKAIA